MRRRVWCAGQRNWRGLTRRTAKLRELSEQSPGLIGQDSRPNVSGGLGSHRSAAAPGSERDGSNTMLALKYLLMILGVGLFGSAGSLVVYDVFISEQLRRLLARNKTSETGAGAGTGTVITAQRPFGPVRWGLAQRLAIAGVVPILLALSIVVIPDGSAGVRVSQIWGARPGTLYPGMHFVTPLVDSVALYDMREQVYSTLASASAKSENEVLVVQAREGLNIGLAVSVRYRLDPRRLDR